MRLARNALLALPFLAAFLLATALLAPAVPVAAQPSAAEAFIRSRHRAAERVLKKRPSPSRTEELTRLLNEMLDYEELSKRALAEHWDKHSAEERSEFVSLLKQLVERSYKSNLERTLRYEVRYESAESTDDGILVKTVARNRENRRAPEVTIDYALHKVDGGFRVHDIRTDGVSLVRNYKNQFNRIIQKEGWDKLLARMKTRLDEGSVL